MITILGMARPRKRFTDYLDASKDSIVEHITKMVMYEHDRPLDKNGWTRTLNKYILRFSGYNVSKKGLHFSEENLFAELRSEFTVGFVQSFCLEAEEIGYPPKEVTEADLKKMLVILKQFCHQVFVPNGRL